jgi:ribosomal protein L37AE/L43A
MSSFEADLDRQFEEILHDGITAAKSGQVRLAQSLLNRASILKPMDALPYLWLSATTDDPKEQREYLEQAVARDPTNAAARRGLAVLIGKLDKDHLMPETGGSLVREPGAQVEAGSQSFKCPRCGGHLAYQVSTGLLACEYCGYETSLGDASGNPQPVADRTEQVLDFVMPTESGHTWAAAQQQMCCENCGAVSLLPPGQKAAQCAYCGSNQLVVSSELGELIDPQVIALIQIDKDQAVRKVRAWLKGGLFAPDNLLSSSASLRLRPAYYSFWTFDGTLEVHWSCEVAEGAGNQKRWSPLTGVQAEFFNDVLVPGVKALSAREVSKIEPFNLVEVEEFKPEFLAGWSTMIYDRSLADASLLAREKVLAQFRPQLYSLVALGHEKRNVSLNSSGWSGMTFKHVLLPVWIATYQFAGREYRLLVNGQTGKVGGDRPKDSIKLILAVLTVATLLILGLLVLLAWIQSRGGL